MWCTMFIFVGFFPSLGKSTPVNMSCTADPSKPCDPFQPFSGDIIDPFQSNKKGLGDPFSGKDPFAPSATSKEPKDLGFADFNSVS